MEFYAIGTDKNGESIVISIQSNNRLEAKHQAIEYCQNNNLRFKGLRTFEGSGRQNAILTKTIKEKRGRKVFWQW
jgi:hypothetical protein